MKCRFSVKKYVASIASLDLEQLFYFSPATCSSRTSNGTWYFSLRPSGKFFSISFSFLSRQLRRIFLSTSFLFFFSLHYCEFVEGVFQASRGFSEGTSYPNNGKHTMGGEGRIFGTMIWKNKNRVWKTWLRS